MRISDWSSDVCSSDLAKALPKHAPVRLAYEAGAEFREIRVGYNPALQKEADRLAEQPGWFKVGYGVTTEPDASPEEVRAFLEVDAPQVANLTASTLVLALGSGNTAAAVLPRPTGRASGRARVGQ